VKRHASSDREKKVKKSFVRGFQLIETKLAPSPKRIYAFTSIKPCTFCCVLPRLINTISLSTTFNWRGFSCAQERYDFSSIKEKKKSKFHDQAAISQGVNFPKKHAHKPATYGHM
jgi:hypothetical protein